MRRTETSDEVVDNTPHECLPLQLHRAQTIDGNGGREGEDDEGEPLNVLEEVVEGERRQRLLVLESPGDIVVRDVLVGRDLLLGGFGLRGRGLDRRRLAGLDDRRHGGRGGEGERARGKGRGA